MAIQTLNNNDSANVYRGKENSNFSELDTGKAPNNHASSSTTYGVATGSLYGHVKVNATNGLSISNGMLSMAQASTTAAGTVMLQNDLNSGSTTKAVTSQAVFNLLNTIPTVYYGSSEPSSSLGKAGDIYIMI